MTISFGIFVIGNESVGQIKVDFYSTPRMAVTCVQVWRHRNTAFHDRNVTGTTVFSGGGVTVWGCFSFNCKLDLHVLQSNLNGVGILLQCAERTHYIPF